MKDWIKGLNDTKFGSGSYSQSYQDELLDIVFSNIGTANSPPFCVEFGFNSRSLTGGSGANTASLVLKGNWDSLLLDGDNENPEINLHRHFLDSSNISDIFRKYNVPKQPEFISIDVDSTDLWLFDAIVKDYKAMVFSVEYNSHYPLESAITFPNDAHEKWERDRGYGASLKALTMVANKYGYSLLWVVPARDAFFIRNDLIDDGTNQICFPFEMWESCTNRICHKPLRNRERASIFIDYEVYVSTNGDLAKSRQSAYPICKKYLLDSIPRKASRIARRVLKRLIQPNRRKEGNG